MSLISYGVQDLLLTGQSETINRYYSYKERTDFEYLRYKEYKNYDSDFGPRLINTLSILKEQMPEMLFKLLILEIMDILESQYWLRKVQGRIFLEIMIPNSFPKQLTGLLLEDVNDITKELLKARLYTIGFLREFPARPYPKLSESERGPYCGPFGCPTGEVGPIGSTYPNLKEETIYKNDINDKKLVQKQMQKDINDKKLVQKQMQKDMMWQQKWLQKGGKRR